MLWPGRLPTHWPETNEEKTKVGNVFQIEPHVLIGTTRDRLPPAPHSDILWLPPHLSGPQ